MKILYLITKEPDAALKTIVEQTQKKHTVKIINLQETKDYKNVIETIEEYDKVISW